MPCSQHNFKSGNTMRVSTGLELSMRGIRVLGFSWGLLQISRNVVCSQSRCPLHRRQEVKGLCSVLFSFLFTSGDYEDYKGFLKERRKEESESENEVAAQKSGGTQCDKDSIHYCCFEEREREPLETRKCKTQILPGTSRTELTLANCLPHWLSSVRPRSDSDVQQLR